MYIFVFFYVSFITSHVLAAKAASKITFCQLNTCRGPLYGECEDTANGFVCHCTSQFKGETCGELFKPGDNPCLQKPCWSGGNCTQIGNEFSCKCPAGRTGLDCKTAIDPITTPIRPLVCFNNATLSNNVCVCLENYIGISCETFVPPPTDAYVKVFNKGWYTATIKLTYRLNEVSWEEKRTITAQRIATFKFDRRVSNVEVTVDALAGRKAFLKASINPINSIYTCFHVWGTTLSPKSSRMRC